MGTKEMKIVPPDGYEVDKQNSTFGCIKFKKKLLTYEDVAKELFKFGTSYYTVSTGKIIKTINNCYYADPNTAASEKQLEKLLAINKLMNVAKYLNGDWKPDWNNPCENKYYIYMVRGCVKIDRLCISPNSSISNHATVYFKSKELAQQAIDILGKDTICLALSTDW